MNPRRLMAEARALMGAPGITRPAAAPHQAPPDPAPCYEREGVAQIDAVGPEMERRNVERLQDSIGFCERDAALRRIHPGPSDWAAVAQRMRAHYETATAAGRRRAGARKARA
jgi:hypothetical protein